MSWKNWFLGIVFLPLIIFMVLVTGPIIAGIILLALIFVYSQNGFPISYFGNIVDQEEQSDEWVTIYETRLDEAFVAVLTSKLRAEEIPVIIENKNLFNMGIHWEFGLSVPLRVRVPAGQKKASLKILREFKRGSDIHISDF